MDRPEKNEASRLALMEQDKFNKTENNFPFISVSQRIQAQAQKHPHKTAVIHSPNQEMTYSELLKLRTRETGQHLCAV